MGKEERELQAAFSRKEKYEKLLSNLEKLREEGSVTDEQYESMKSNYTQAINEATSTIEQIKRGISRDLESEEKTLEAYEQELKNLEARFKVGELSAEEYQKLEQKTRSKIERAQAKVSELKRLLDSKSSADVGGYAEPGERKGAKAVSAGKGLPALEEIIANKKILFGIIGIVAVVAIIVGIALVGFGGTSAKDVMNLLPESASFLYIDYKTLRADKDLAPVWKEAIREYAGLEKYGVSKLSFLGVSGGVYLAGGDFELEEIRYELDDNGFHKGAYMGEEIWKKEGYQTEAVALLGDKIIWGNEYGVQDAIRVIKGEKASLYESNPKMARIADKLHGGFLVMIMSAPAYSKYKDLEAMGTSIQKISEWKLKVQSVFLFDDKYSAGNAVDDIRSDLEDAEYLNDVEISVSDRYVTATATCDIEDWEKVWWQQKGGINKW